MIPGVLNLTIRQGDTFSQVITIYNAGATNQTPGTPVDLTGCSAELAIVPLYGSVPLLKLNSTLATTNGSIIVLGGTSGTITLTITPADTTTLNNGSYDLKVKFTNNSIETFVAGSIFVLPAVTAWV